jgi:hypothetical protein
MRVNFSTPASTAVLVLMALMVLLAWSPPVMAQHKTVKECRDEWRAAKAAVAANGKTQGAFIAECRGVPLAERKPPVMPAMGKGQYANEGEAKNGCRGDPVVWVNLRSGVYHDNASRSYGATKSGAYMCERDSVAGGFRASKTPKEPSKESTNPAHDPAKAASS